MFTIGEFSKLGRISPRMLRYYDAMGLLRPEQIGAENGYRYYSAEHPEYKVVGPSMERYLVDMDTVENEEDLKTGVLFPVEKVE